MTRNTGSTSGYVLANAGTLFGSSGVPQYTEYLSRRRRRLLADGLLRGDRLKQPGIIQGSFTDDGLVVENGVQVHVWTYSYYNGSTPEYMTVNNYFPSNGRRVHVCRLCQTIANTSNVLWAPLMEKAYARIYGGDYASLNGGWAQNILPMETGGSCASNNLFGSESTYIAAIQSPTTLLTLAPGRRTMGSWPITTMRSSRSRAPAARRCFSSIIPGASHQPPAITWAQLTQPGIFTQDGDTIVRAAAATGLPYAQATSGGLALVWQATSVRTRKTQASAAPAFHAPLGGDATADYFAEIVPQLNAVSRTWGVNLPA